MLNTGLPIITLIAAASLAPCVWLALVGFRANRLLLYGPLTALMIGISWLTMANWTQAYWIPIIILNTWVPQVLATGILRHHDRRDREMYIESADDYRSSRRQSPRSVRPLASDAGSSLASPVDATREALREEGQSRSTLTPWPASCRIARELATAVLPIATSTRAIGRLPDCDCTRSDAADTPTPRLSLG
jgi:hypothetical protein